MIVAAAISSPKSMIYLLDGGEDGRLVDLEFVNNFERAHFESLDLLAAGKPR